MPFFEHTRLYSMSWWAPSPFLLLAMASGDATLSAALVLGSYGLNGGALECRRGVIVANAASL